MRKVIRYKKYPDEPKLTMNDDKMMSIMGTN